MTVRRQQEAPSLLQIDAIGSRLQGTEALTETCRFLRHEFPHYSWVGIYRRQGEMLVLDAWDGEEEAQHQRIPVAEGLCGKAVREARTIVVGDVSAAPEFLACSLSTRSEIVVPIRRDGQVIAEIDIDGTALNAYDASDARFLEKVAERLARHVRTADPSPTPA